MIIKRIVTISLFSALGIMFVLLLVGLFVPTKTLEKFSRASSDEQTVVAVDKDGKTIEGATIKVQADGTTVVVDASGQAIAGASAAAQATSTVAAAPAATTPAAGGSTTPSSGGTTTPPATGGSSTPAPVISSFTASPTSIAYNASSTLSWTSSNATSCTISNLGAVAASGSKSTGALTATTTYTITCTGSVTASKTATVTVGAAPVACGSPGGVCTAAQVATHNSKTNCWVIYGGNYHIVTSYVNQHDGGSGAFTSSTCGRDITAYMNGSSNAGTTVGKNAHKQSSYTLLNSFKVGAVVN